MTINHFAGTQNVVFVPALLLVLLATVAICVPIVLAPGLRRSGRLRATVVVGAVVAVVALGLAVPQTTGGFSTLGGERAALRTDLQREYGMTFTAEEVGTLMDGGKIPRALPDLASTLGLRPKGSGEEPYNLQIQPKAKGSDVYVLTYGDVDLPTV